MIRKFFAQLSKRERVVAYVTIGAVLLAFLDRLFLGPVLGSLKDIDEQIARQKATIQAELKYLSRKDDIVRQNQVFEEYFTTDVKDDDVINRDFLNLLETLAVQSKVKLVKSQASDKKTSKEYAEYYANLDCVGTLKDIVTFMHLINTTKELCKVVKFNIVPKRGSSDVNASMTVVKLVMPAALSKKTGDLSLNKKQ